MLVGLCRWAAALPAIFFCGHPSHAQPPELCYSAASWSRPRPGSSPGFVASLQGVSLEDGRCPRRLNCVRRAAKTLVAVGGCSGRHRHELFPAYGIVSSHSTYQPATVMSCPGLFFSAHYTPQPQTDSSRRFSSAAFLQSSPLMMFFVYFHLVVVVYAFCRQKSRDNV